MSTSSSLNNVVRQTVLFAIMQDVPAKITRQDMMAQCNLEIDKDVAESELPESVKAMWANKSERKWLGYGSFCFNAGSVDIAFSMTNIYLTLPVQHSLTIETSGKIKAHINAFTDGQGEIEQLRQKLKLAFASIRTRAMFIEAFPQFEKYLPAVTYNTPVVCHNFMAEMTKMGWPKEKAVS
jgi:hypothetical protein